MRLQVTEIPGCFTVELTAFNDVRGNFAKTFRASTYREMGLEWDFTESFYSCSGEGVLRGMHFQLPPADGAKLVYAVSGEVLDVALDLRVGSPAFGKAVSFVLSPEKPRTVYIPRGMAHGFVVLRGPATLIYNISAEYDPKLDTGVRWDSFDMDWRGSNFQVSARDRLLPALASFESPFRYAPVEAAV